MVTVVSLIGNDPRRIGGTEEYAREMIVNEEQHLDEVDKMLRRPGAIERFER